MGIDVLTEIEIERPRAEVAAFACDPDRAQEWYRNIKSVEWETAPPVRVGSRIRFGAVFLGHRMEYTYEVLELVEARRFVMATTEGQFPMETTYEWEDAGTGRTRMTLRNRGKPRGLAGVIAGLQSRAVRRANEADLRRLKELLEA